MRTCLCPLGTGFLPVCCRVCCYQVAFRSILSCPTNWTLVASLVVARFRCSIVRLLQWRTTLVKRRSDPSRYVIDLKNNADAPAAQHKTVLPLPKLMTAFLDDLRASRKVSGTRSDCVFVNSKGDPYSTSEHTAHSQVVFVVLMIEIAVSVKALGLLLSRRASNNSAAAETALPPTVR